jgi:membrane protein implicated in regulation of membrane protease activity
MDYYYWFIAALVLSLIEILTPGFVILWFGVSAAIVAVLDLLGLHDTFLQVLIWVILSLLMVVMSRTFFKTIFVKSPGENYKTNVDVLIGKTAIVTEQIDNVKGAGRIKVEGQDWAARSEDNSIIPEGKTVEIIKYEGIKMFVKIIN